MSGWALLAIAGGLVALELVVVSWLRRDGAESVPLESDVVTVPDEVLSYLRAVAEMDEESEDAR